MYITYEQDRSRRRHLFLFIVVYAALVVATEQTLSDVTFRLSVSSPFIDDANFILFFKICDFYIGNNNSKKVNFMTDILDFFPPKVVVFKKNCDFFFLND